MANIDQRIKIIDKFICDSIDMYDNNRGYLSQTILSHLRNLVELVVEKVSKFEQNIPNEKFEWDKVKPHIKYLKTKSNIGFLVSFHNLLQHSVSHYTEDEENSERLMLKYYSYLLKLKKFLKEEYNMEILHNINKFPIDLDTHFLEYYKEISNQVDWYTYNSINNFRWSDRYYVQKIKPFFVNNNIYYEVTLTLASEYNSKFNRVIAFTRFEIPTNYAVKVKTDTSIINVYNKQMSILIITEWTTSIRICEFNNFFYLIGLPYKTNSNNNEYRALMRYLTEYPYNLTDIVQAPDYFYNDFKQKISLNAKITPICRGLDCCRKIINNNEYGKNVIRYLLYKPNNKIIKKQINQYEHDCYKFKNMNISCKCLPFDEMPFTSSLVEHNPDFFDIMVCIPSQGRKHEFLARTIQENTENKAQLYTPLEDLKEFDNLDELISTYNNNVYYKHPHRKLEIYSNYLYMRGYEEKTYKIISQLINLSSSGYGETYTNYVNNWLLTSNYDIDCEEKKFIINQLFFKSKVAIIYGSAGTGKSTLISHISNMLENHKKLYLAQTNPAVENLKRRVKVENCDFKTITKFINSNDGVTDYDFLFIDECSTVSNFDMLNILNKSTSVKGLGLVGDIYQIESIQFGNWFNIARYFIPQDSIFELKNPYRSKDNQDLQKFWDMVRNMEEDNYVIECIVKDNYSKSLDETIFQRKDDDEIILCLNYDGLYGINNLNHFLQDSNNHPSIKWGLLSYKVGDPILFNECERFVPVVHNNLKGKIVNIVPFENRIQFDIEVEKSISEEDLLEVCDDGIMLLENYGNDKSLIRLFINKYMETDEDDNSNSKATIPFQVAYAVSIHKAQGLEYNSVKIVITNQVEELISHNIFYTAITRARKNLTIYWSPETEHKVITGLKHMESKRDAQLLSNKYNLKMVKTEKLKIK